jgi:hypothetical protein
MDIGDIWGNITGGAEGIWEYLNNEDSAFGIDDIGKLLGIYGGYEGWFNSDQEKAGYQGSIPNLTAVRDQVPIDWNSNFNDSINTIRRRMSDGTATDENAEYYQNFVENGSNVPVGEEGRRPGEYGQRYFTDTTYAQRPETTLPTIAEAQAQTDFQSAQLAAQNPQNVYARGGIVDAIRGGGRQNRPPMPSQARGVPQRSPNLADLGSYSRPSGNFAQGGIVEAMNALKNAPPMPQQAPPMPQRQQQMPQQQQRPPMPPQAQGMPQRPPMPQRQQQVPPQGITGAPQANYKRGPTDGMGDQMPARIDGQAPAKFSHGEFVIPADVVSHAGNGNSEAGAEQLYAMMDRIRQARTGSKQQSKQINPNTFMPA